MITLKSVKQLLPLFTAHHRSPFGIYLATTPNVSGYLSHQDYFQRQRINYAFSSRTSGVLAASCHYSVVVPHPCAAVKNEQQQRRQFSRSRHSSLRRPGKVVSSSSEKCEEEGEKSRTNSTYHQQRTEQRENIDPTERHYNERRLSLQDYKAIVKEAWRQYKWTWQGFLTPKHKLTEEDFIYKSEEQLEREKLEREQQKEKNNCNENDWKVDEESKAKSPEELLQNFRRNVLSLRTEGPKLAKEITGMSTKEELKAWAAAQMRLTADCLSHFMQGYREGRDEEIDKMLNEYFKEKDKDEHEKNDDEVKGNIRRPRRRRLSIRYSF